MCWDLKKAVETCQHEETTIIGGNKIIKDHLQNVTFGGYISPWMFRANLFTDALVYLFLSNAVQGNRMSCRSRGSESFWLQL